MFIASLICSDKVENNFYRFTQNMMTSERGLKLKLYPSLAFSIAIPLIFLNMIVGLGEFVAQLPYGLDSQVGESGVQLSGGQR